MTKKNYFLFKFMFLWKNGESEKKSEAISTVPPAQRI